MNEGEKKIRFFHSDHARTKAFLSPKTYTYMHSQWILIATSFLKTILLEQ